MRCKVDSFLIKQLDTHVLVSNLKGCYVSRSEWHEGVSSASAEHDRFAEKLHGGGRHGRRLEARHV